MLILKPLQNKTSSGDWEDVLAKGYQVLLLTRASTTSYTKQAIWVSFVQGAHIWWMLKGNKKEQHHGGVVPLYIYINADSGAYPTLQDNFGEGPTEVTF